MLRLNRTAKLKLQILTKYYIKYNLLQLPDTKMSKFNQATSTIKSINSQNMLVALTVVTNTYAYHMNIAKSPSRLPPASVPDW